MLIFATPPFVFATKQSVLIFLGFLPSQTMPLRFATKTSIILSGRQQPFMLKS